jgi:nucleoside-diphosphate-sugar epimerase
MDSKAKRTALVTGASGFIGVHLVRRLAACGWRISCLVRSTSRVDELRGPGLELIKGDVNDSAGMVRAVAASKASVVFHLAGLVRAASAAAFLRANQSGAESVAAACADQGVPPVLVLVSSLAAAGPSGGAPRVESELPLPVSEYGRSKLAGELAAARYAGVVPITIVRPCVVFGPGDRGVYQMIKPIARYGIHVVPGRGDRRLSIVAVPDLVECVLLAAKKGERLVPGGSGAGGVHGEAGRGVYFASAEDLSYVELGNAIAQALGTKDARAIHLPEWSLRALGHLGDAASQVRRSPGWVGTDKIADVLAGSWVSSSEKVRRQLGWSPAASTADRLRDTVEWYRDKGWL